MPPPSAVLITLTAGQSGSVRAGARLPIRICACAPGTTRVSRHGAGAGGGAGAGPRPRPPGLAPERRPPRAAPPPGFSPPPPPPPPPPRGRERGAVGEGGG